MTTKHNTDSESESSSKESEMIQVSLQWVYRQFGRVLEMFIILQFVAGALVFFAGIFFLLWAVVPATSLQAGSYMMLAFYIIGRALLGLVGFYTDNFCLLFSYGVLLLATFVVRTIMTLVRLKIMTSPDSQLNIPPLLQAAPGALPSPIELVCALLEGSQALCAFYLCWIVTKTQTIEKEVDESKINFTVANEVARYLHQKEMSARKEDTDNETIDSGGANYDKNDSNLEESNDSKSARGRKGSVAIETSVRVSTQISSVSVTPLKGILHQPSNYSQSNQTSSTMTTQTHHLHAHQQHEHHCPAATATHIQCSTPQDYFNMYRKYPHTQHPPQSDSFAPIGNSLKGIQIDEDQDDEKYEDEEDLDVLIEDYHNNNNHLVNKSTNSLASRGNSWFAPNPHFEAESTYCEPTPSYTAHCLDSPPSMEHDPRLASERNAEHLSSTLASEFNSPLLYNRSVTLYTDYGSTANLPIDHYANYASIYP